jgi:hypothetical protein
VFEVATDKPRAELDQVTIYLEGLLESTKDGDPEYKKERRAICLSSALYDLKAGKYTLTVKSDTARHICMFRKARGVFGSKLVHLTGRASVPACSLLIASGSVVVNGTQYDSPRMLVTSGPTELYGTAVCVVLTDAPSV